jgi:hypothetical protein
VGRKNHCLPVNKSLMALLLCTWLVKSLPMRQLSIKSNYREVYILICCALSSTQITNSIVLEAFNHSKFHSRVTPISSIYCIAPKESSQTIQKENYLVFQKSFKISFKNLVGLFTTCQMLPKMVSETCTFGFQLQYDVHKNLYHKLITNSPSPLFFINSTKIQ